MKDPETPTSLVIGNKSQRTNVDAVLTTICVLLIILGIINSVLTASLGGMVALIAVIAIMVVRINWKMAP